MQELFIPGGGMGSEEGTITEWSKQPGDRVAAGDIVAVIETDKAMVEIEAEIDGVLGPHLHPEGAALAAGSAIGHVLAPGEEGPQ